MGPPGAASASLQLLRTGGWPARERSGEDLCLIVTEHARIADHRCNRHGPVVYRYDPAVSPDGLRGSEGTSNLYTFLYVQALAKAGRIHQARYTFDNMLAYANHVGLFAEEIGPSGE